MKQQTLAGLAKYAKTTRRVMARLAALVPPPRCRRKRGRRRGRCDGDEVQRSSGEVGGEGVRRECGRDAPPTGARRHGRVLPAAPGTQTVVGRSGCRRPRSPSAHDGSARVMAWRRSSLHRCPDATCRAIGAQWKTERAAARPNTARLAWDERLPQCMQDRLTGAVADRPADRCRNRGIRRPAPGARRAAP